MSCDVRAPAEEQWRHLEQVGPDALVGALLGHLLGQPRDLVRGLGDVLGTLDEGALVSAASAHQTRHLGHEQGHPLGSADDVVSLRWMTRDAINRKE